MINVMTINEIQDELIEDFSALDDWLDRYQMIIDYAKELKPLDESEHTEQNLIDGCQSKVWFVAHMENGNIIAMTAENTYTFNAEPNSVSERFQIVGRNNVVTGMENSAVLEGANKRIENGKVVIIKNGVKYDVLGAQL